VGIDISSGMLQEAAKKSFAQRASVEWIQGDIREFSLDKQFSLVVFPANALCHLLTLRDFEVCLECVMQHLAPNGRFVIDVFVPKAELLINKPGQRSPFSEYEDPDGRGRIVVTESYVYEPATQIKKVTTHHKIPGIDAELEGRLDLRMYFPQELDALVKYNGFTIEAKYGDYDRSAFTSESEKQLIVCTKSR
jgi:SAM-dependent methyltransferase